MYPKDYRYGFIKKRGKNYVLCKSYNKNKNQNKSTYEEGCLSVPNQFAEIDRPKTCEIEYLDYNGTKKLLKAEGLLATCIQHEINHYKNIIY